MGCLPLVIWQLIFVITNGVIALSGIVLIAFGTYLLNFIGIRVTKLLQLNLNIVLLALGIYILAIAILGFVGFFKKSALLLMIFGGLVIMNCIATFAIAFTAISMNLHPADYADQLGSLYDNKDADSLRAIDELQTNIRCCGPNGPTEMKEFTSSCCEAEVKKCDQSNAYQAACIERVQVIIRYFLMGATWGSLITCGVSILCLISAFCIRADVSRQEMQERRQ
ncbi:leukocyte surface antigen CD53-like [Rhodnius prolixus]